jgi:nucleotide-binding universal stress UspA family protein
MTEDISTTVMDFHDARRKAVIETLFARLRGQSVDLLPYEDVRRMLKATSSTDRGLHEIPLDAIVGSVGRYNDFTRSFLPKYDNAQDRWARVKQAFESMTGVPPIEVYQLSDVYFVKDGNHRVSIARQLGAEYIQAYVTEVQTRVPLSPDIEPDDLIIKAEYAEFLEHTGIDDVRPEADLNVTAPGKYAELEEHISVHRYYMGLDQDRPIPKAEAVAHWYDTVYQPTVRIIRQLGILRDFPDRTETDLYLWLSEHREALRETLGVDVETAAAAKDLSNQYSAKPGRVLARVGEKLLGAVTPNELDSGPPPGAWRKAHMPHPDFTQCLFHDILVPLNGQESGWQTLDQAIEIAQRECGHVYGLHVVPTDAHKERKPVLDMEAEFGRRCAEADVPGSLMLETGNVTDEIVARAPWVDLVVASLNYPPGSDPIAKLQSGFRTMLQRSPTPVLAVPRPLFPLETALLAFDGSAKSREALFVATYLAARWASLSLVVLTAGQEDAEATLATARLYIEEHGVPATYLIDKTRPAGDAILHATREHAATLIIMGSYGRGAVLEMVLGSTVNQVLRESRCPVLICR